MRMIDDHLSTTVSHGIFCRFFLEEFCLESLESLTSTCLRWSQKMPILLQPEEEVDLTEAHSKSTGSNALAPRQLPPWLRLSR